MREAILEEREKTHGDFQKGALIWRNLVKAGPMPENPAVAGPQSIAQCLAINMIYVKLARILSGQSMHKDHWTDIAGYAKLGEEACE